MKRVLINLQGMAFTEVEAKEYYGKRYDTAILAKAIIDEDGNVIGNWED